MALTITTVVVIGCLMLSGLESLYHAGKDLKDEAVATMDEALAALAALEEDDEGDEDGEDEVRESVVPGLGGESKRSHKRSVRRARQVDCERRRLEKRRR